MSRAVLSQQLRASSVLHTQGGAKCPPRAPAGSMCARPTCTKPRAAARQRMPALPAMLPSRILLT
eukprot:scaffold177_cov334-Pavlova_lutheri.AAC.68